MFEHGADLKVVSEALGHSSIRVTADVYAHLLPERSGEAAAAMTRALTGAWACRPLVSASVGIVASSM
jgi:integrase